VGEADCFLAFERLEAMRYIEQLRPGGTLVVSKHGIPPNKIIPPNRPFGG